MVLLGCWEPSCPPLSPRGGAWNPGLECPVSQRPWLCTLSGAGRPVGGAVQVATGQTQAPGQISTGSQRPWVTEGRGRGGRIDLLER